MFGGVMGANAGPGRSPKITKEDKEAPSSTAPKIDEGMLVKRQGKGKGPSFHVRDGGPAPRAEPPRDWAGGSGARGRQAARSGRAGLGAHPRCMRSIVS